MFPGRFTRKIGCTSFLKKSKSSSGTAACARAAAASKASPANLERDWRTRFKSQDRFAQRLANGLMERPPANDANERQFQSKGRGIFGLPPQAHDLVKGNSS